MKVVIATGLYPPEIGGPATYAHMLETSLPGRGFTVEIVPFGWVRHYPKIIRHVVYAWKLWHESKDADVVYALDPISVGIPASWVAKFLKKPFLIRLGGDYAWEQGRVRFGLKQRLDDYLKNMDGAPFMVRLLARLQTYVCNRANTIVVPSKYLKSVVAQWGIEEDKITVIYSALYPIEVSGSKDELRKKLSFTHPTIVSAGRLVPWKGFVALVKVVSRLKQQYPNISLVIAGEGEDRSAIEKEIHNLKIEDSIRLISSVSKDALGATIKAGDVFVLNTAYEGLSHQLLEVMDIGTPIVTTPAGGNPELITEGVTGLMVPFNNVDALEEAIARVLNHPEMVTRMTQSARARSKEFSETNAVSKIADLLQSV